MRKWILCIAFAIPFVNSWGQNISIFAGSFPFGNGLLATSVSLYGPNAVAIFNDGNLLISVRGTGKMYKVNAATGIISEFGNFSAIALLIDPTGNVYLGDYTKVWKITPAGVMTVFAGTSVQGFGGDGGLATAANLNYASGLAMDASGNLFISDQVNSRVRKVNTSGIISTVVGDGTTSFTDNVQATTTGINSPTGLAFDASGNLFIAEQGTNRIRKVSTSQVITTAVGTGVAGSSGDSGPANAAQINLQLNNNYAAALAFDGSGNLFIADKGNGKIRKVNTSNIITTLASTIVVAGVAVDAGGNVYTAGYLDYRVRKVAPDGAVSVVAGNGYANFWGDGGLAVDAGIDLNIYTYNGIARDGNGNVYFSDYNNGRIRKINSSGIISTVVSESAIGLATDAAGNLFYSTGNSIKKFDNSGTISTVQTGYFPLGLAVDGANNLYFASGTYHRVYKRSSAGVVTAIAGTGVAGNSGDGSYAYNAKLYSPNGVAVDQSGNIYISDDANDNVRKVAAATGFISTVYSFIDAWGIAVNGAGAVYVADRNGGVIMKNGLILGGVNPQGVAVSTDGIVYAAGGGAIRKIQALGFITIGALSQTYNGTPLSVSVTTVPASLPTLVTYNGSPTAPTNAGSYPVIVSINHTDYYGTASGTLTINKATQTIAFSPLPTKVCGDVFSLGATSSSLLAVTYTSTNTSVATVSVDPVTLLSSGTALSSGTTTIRASQAGNNNYLAGTPVDQALTVNPRSQTITFGPLSPVTYGDAPFTLLATSTAGLAISYSSSNTAVATTSGATLTIVGAGTTTITAAQTGNSCYNVATSVPQSLVVNKKAQTITFNTLSNKTFGNPPFTVSAIASSNLAVTFTSITLPTTTVSGTNGTTVTIVGGGAATIRASQSGNSNYLTAPDVDRSFTINKANQTISFGPLSPLCGLVSIALTGTASSGLPISYTSSNTGVATISSNSLTGIGIGSSTITAAQSGNGNYNAATSINQIQIVNPAVRGTISQSGNLCADGKVYLTAGAGNSYSWGTQTIEVYEEGTYEVSYLNVYGCPVSASISVSRIGGGCMYYRKNLDPNPISIVDDQPNYKFGVYPNPANDQIMVVLTTPAETECSVILYDILGRLRKTETIQTGSKEKTIQVEDLEAGIYLVDIKDNKNNRKRKLIIQRN